MGKGQQLNASVNWSRYSRSIEAGFLDPYFLDKSIALGGQIYHRDYSSFNFVGNNRNTTYKQVSDGATVRTGFPLTEYMSVSTRYSLVRDRITLDKASFYSDPDGNGPQPSQCDPLLAGRYLCDEIGSRLTSSAGYALAFDNTDGIRPTKGQRWTITQDFAGLGGDVRYLRTTVDATKYKGLGGGFVFSLHGEGGYIHSFQKSPGAGRDPIRLTDRFFGPQLRGFDIRGIGPRILRYSYDLDGNIAANQKRVTDALGGRAYYMGRAELELPTNSTLRSVGIRPSAFIDVGSLFDLKKPILTDVIATCVPIAENTTGVPFQIVPGGSVTSCGPGTGPNGFGRAPGFQERFVGDSAKPRLSVGVGFNWTSPFGPLRIDIAKALLKQEGDDTKFFSFNVGTSF
jgi:outer membrane protein insertion porin family